MNSYLETLPNSNIDKPRLIVCAAMRDRKTGNVLCSVRHWDSFTHWLFDSPQASKEFDDEQGFVDNKRNFLTREEAWKVALEARQIKYRCGGDIMNGGTLFSENLY